MLPYCEVSYEINDKLVQNCLPEFFLPLELTWSSLSSVSMWRLMVCQNPATPCTFSSSGQLLDWPKWLKLKKIKYRQHLLDINSQMSGVGANVLAADGREASRVHADCSLHQRWTSAHEWEYCPLRRGGRGKKKKKKQCYGAPMMKNSRLSFAWRACFCGYSPESYPVELR